MASKMINIILMINILVIIITITNYYDYITYLNLNSFISNQLTVSMLIYQHVSRLLFLVFELIKI